MKLNLFFPLYTIITKSGHLFSELLTLNLAFFFIHACYRRLMIWHVLFCDEKIRVTLKYLDNPDFHKGCLCSQLHTDRSGCHSCHVQSTRFDSPGLSSRAHTHSACWRQGTHGREHRGTHRPAPWTASSWHILVGSNFQHHNNLKWIYRYVSKLLTTVFYTG